MMIQTLLQAFIEATVYASQGKSLNAKTWKPRGREHTESRSSSTSAIVGHIGEYAIANVLCSSSSSKHLSNDFARICSSTVHFQKPQTESLSFASTRRFRCGKLIEPPWRVNSSVLYNRCCPPSGHSSYMKKMNMISQRRPPSSSFPKRVRLSSRGVQWFSILCQHSNGYILRALSMGLQSCREAQIITRW